MQEAANKALNDSLILLTGATGYVGGRLLRALEAAGSRVRCLARRPEFLHDRVGRATEVVRGDVLDAESLKQAMTGVTTAYYLVHSMGSWGEFEEEDRRAAQNFADAARAAGVTRIIYLGGLGEAAEKLSPHLRSRHEVGEILRSTGVPAIEFRASIVIGSGSLSFELIRALVERLPVMIAPRWVSVPAQPIAINDLIAYLLAAIDLPLDASRIFEIGGADTTSYGELMHEYARHRGLRRWIIPVPVLTPRLSSLWLGLVTPIYARVGRKLIDSIRHPTVVNDPAALQAFSIRPCGFREAIAAAMRNEDAELAETRWSDALSAAGQSRSWFGIQFGSRLIDSRVADVAVPADQAFRPIERIGGRSGWYYANWLWRLRGALDLLIGGVGMRRGRRDPEHLCVGDTLDCWRVEAMEPNRRLRLAAEMKLPGRAWLEFEVTAKPAGGSRIRQTAEYDPVGVLGRAYWYAVYPLHQLVFSGMLRQIAARAEAPKGSANESPHRLSMAAQALGLLAWMIACFAAAGLGGLLTALSVGGWYQTLAKPSWTPPDSVFGPVWSTLYFMMAVAAWLVWRGKRSSCRDNALAWFGIQLVLNVAWSGCFFALERPGLAFLELLLLLGAIVVASAAFLRVSRLAAVLMMPYLLWCTFAAGLNYSIWRLNFGHISPHELFHELMSYERWSAERLAKKATGKRSGWWGVSAGAQAWLDDFITWRELGYNMAAHRDDYDRYESLPDWSRATLEKHGRDRRAFLYSLDELTAARTHDELWNPAQTQLVREGRIHNYLRMLWGKKILEWTRTPHDAIDVMTELNNRFALDGRDPNSYSGIFWVLGRYDRPWGPERPIFGTVRYMSSENTRRKLRVTDYLAKFQERTT